MSHLQVAGLCDPHLRSELSCTPISPPSPLAHPCTTWGSSHVEQRLPFIGADPRKRSKAAAGSSGPAAALPRRLPEPPGWVSLGRSGRGLYAARPYCAMQPAQRVPACCGPPGTFLPERSPRLTPTRAVLQPLCCPHNAGGKGLSWRCRSMCPQGAARDGEGQRTVGNHTSVCSPSRATPFFAYLLCGASSGAGNMLCGR